MKKIKRIEIEEITPNIKTGDLIELAKKFPDLDMVFSVVLYGSPENGNAAGIDDAPRIELLKAMNSMKDAAHYETAVHLNHGYCNVFAYGQKFEDCTIWDTIGKDTDRVVYNLISLSEEQKQNWDPANFNRMLATRANPDSDLFTNSEYYIVLNTKLTYSFVYRKIWKFENEKLLRNLKSLVNDNLPENWIVGSRNIMNEHDVVAAAIKPAAWSGGINPGNIGFALTNLCMKLGGDVEKIDICARSGVMTGGVADMDKIEMLMATANEWQERFNGR
ncbi:MAG: hypothetical protein LBG89_02800 [Rickettsiales bacterium]|jgi:hypothetical protein|nr:hypothetical protein [Rickettsiales bacterium]